MKQKLLLLFFLLGVFNVATLAQRKILETEDNGFQWYKIYNDQIPIKYGAEDINGNTIIPLRRGYESIIFHPGKNITGYFKVILYDKGDGICDINGKELISPNRGYDWVYFCEENDHIGYFCVKKNGKVGACDMSGHEIIPPQYSSVIYYGNRFEYRKSEKDDFHKTNISLDEHGKVFNYNNRNYSSIEEPSNGLLYSGIYTTSGQGRDNTTGQVTSDIGDVTNEIKIYEDCITIDGAKYEFHKKQGSTRVYKGTGMGFGGMSSQDYYYVDTNYNMKKVAEFSSAYGTNWVTYFMSKGETTMPKYSNESSGSNLGSSYGNSNGNNNGNRRTTTGTSNNRRTCAQCKFTNGKCPVCKGTRKIQGSYGAKIDCNHCEGSGRCPKCNGTGFTN